MLPSASLHGVSWQGKQPVAAVTPKHIRCVLPEASSHRLQELLWRDGAPHARPAARNWVKPCQQPETKEAKQTGKALGALFSQGVLGIAARGQ